MYSTYAVFASALDTPLHKMHIYFTRMFYGKNCMHIYIYIYKALDKRMPRLVQGATYL